MSGLSFSFELTTHRVEDPTEFVTADAVMDVAAAAEREGFAACHVTDHPAPDAKWLDHGGHHALDPFVALSFAAAATERLRLLTNIYVVAYRNPFLSAKSVQSLHVLSGGRLVLGVGAGYLKPEFAALGVDFDERNDLFDEALTVMAQAWTGDDAAVDGCHFSARGVRLRPALSSPPPIWIGGNSDRAIRRAVEHHDGWAPFGTGGYGRAARTADIDGVGDLAGRVARAREFAGEVGRTDPLEICYSAGGLGDPADSVEQRREIIESCRAAGVTWLPISIPGDSRGRLLEATAAFADEFIR